MEAQIKQLAKKGELRACQTLAKQLVALRRQKVRNITTGSRIGAVGAQTKAMGANVVVAGAIGTATGAMQSANSAMNAERVAAMLQQFERENAQMEMKEEMSMFLREFFSEVSILFTNGSIFSSPVDEALESIMGESDEEFESDALMNSVLEEIGIEVSQKVIIILFLSLTPPSF